ncbi:hypothetical protein B296_00041173 [Ensete ventricosum]|uniref:Inosine/uridine-preferring nucleoside hydrolase domain-containing protein n=1 Tax=Ensete ventricosum TaxID=4639 RepID=A0A426YG32_ENSVE|nr:hypothetical protein B296_00041173 [Ensete ventricosum]
MDSDSIDGSLVNNGRNHAPSDGPMKVIIDTDPGIGAPLFPFSACIDGGKPCVADYVHGSDGFGNIFLPSPVGKKIEKSASEFLVDKVSQYPGDVSILALGPLTNLALIYGDPEAADIVFTSGADIVVVGINITTQVKFTALRNYSVISDADLCELRNSQGRHSQILCDMCKFYRDWHVKSDGVYGRSTVSPCLSLSL